MGFYRGPKIVTDGLVLYLDAANTKSYPGTGTTWKDLSGNGNNGTLVNGVGYNSNNLGSLSFDGVNDYINCGNNSSLSFNFENFHLSLWIKTSSTSGADWMGVIAKYSTTGIWIQLNPSNRYVGFGWDGSNYMLSSTTVASGTWRYVSCQRTSFTGGEIYVDRNLVMSSSSLPNKTSDSGTQLDVGRINISNRYFNGNIAQVSIYNRVLTANEVLQNFNATKGRYGL